MKLATLQASSWDLRVFDLGIRSSANRRCDMRTPLVFSPQVSQSKVVTMSSRTWFWEIWCALGELLGEQARGLLRCPCIYALKRSCIALRVYPHSVCVLSSKMLTGCWRGILIFLNIVYFFTAYFLTDLFGISPVLTKRLLCVFSSLCYWDIIDTACMSRDQPS